MKDFLSMILDRKGRENEIHHPVTLDDVKKNPIVESYLAATDRHMSYLGYIEHGKRHASLVSSISYNILRRLGRSEREAELAGIAGYLHDLGSLINRHDHAKAGALLANQILLGMGMNPREVAEIVAAIGNHDENSFEPVSGITAALVLADKSDVHRSRVRSNETDKFSIYDRVNYWFWRTNPMSTVPAYGATKPTNFLFTTASITPLKIPSCGWIPISGKFCWS